MLGIIITACVLFIPLTGKKYENLWLGPNSEYNIEKHSVIVEKDVDKDFVIVQLTDMQLWSSSKDNNFAFETAETVIKQVEPDLVVFTGDNVSGVGVPELLKTFVKKIEELAVKYDFLWAPIFGNHDNEMRATPNWSGDQYLKVSRENGGHCLFQKGPTNLGDEYGDLLGNYVINVKAGDKIVQSLYMLDNSAYAEYPKELKNAVYEKEGRNNKERPFPYAQIEWCKWQANNINRISGSVVPSIFFTHCAPYEMGDVLLKYVAGPNGRLDGQIADNSSSDDLQKQDSEGYWTISGAYVPPTGVTPEFKPASDSEVEYPIVDGKQLKGILGRFAYVPSHALYNTGIVDSMKDLGLKGWFVGHDHENDIVFEYDDIIYGYGLKAGPSPKPWNDSYFFGGTKIVMDNDGNISPTHIITQKASNYWNKN
ncbi:MAG: metallophosphoesterase, partial [Clostridia bacterium]|nr:metallophosphoesterase [Clostridia bacterium]